MRRPAKFFDILGFLYGLYDPVLRSNVMSTWTLAFLKLHLISNFKPCA